MKRQAKKRKMMSAIHITEKRIHKCVNKLLAKNRDGQYINGKVCKQVLHKRRYTNGKNTHEQMLRTI
jgi:hypothetical protein